ncbi:MAG: hypothetical protein Homavirus44_4 [Homavirus sp.]|uniref:Uncharacterized protein n=1 Tax=Homavirus sp. TaxID=2487769 RepID=A0A3G5A595_9VIRU|nr:MAG: hypothetical protein Homavirus44_4 [Homavirus sp.]
MSQLVRQPILQRYIGRTLATRTECEKYDLLEHDIGDRGKQPVVRIGNDPFYESESDIKKETNMFRLSLLQQYLVSREKEMCVEDIKMILQDIINMMKNTNTVISEETLRGGSKITSYQSNHYKQLRYYPTRPLVTSKYPYTIDYAKQRLEEEFSIYEHSYEKKIWISSSRIDYLINYDIENMTYNRPNRIDSDFNKYRYGC